MDIFKTRRQKLIGLFGRYRIEAFLVTNIKNIQYLTGFTGSTAMILLSKDSKEVFITDFRYEEQTKKEVRGIEIFIADNYIKALRQFIRRWKIQNVGFEASQPYNLFQALQKFSRPRAVEFLVERLRIIKDRDELQAIKEAVYRAERAFLEIKHLIRAGNTERQIALALEEKIKRQGSTRIPFEIIVASGENSAMPHAKPTEKILQPGDLVIIDWGAEANGYFSDMTRTFLIDGPDIKEKIKIYNIVKKANEMARNAVVPGTTAAEVDRHARDYINSQHYALYFRHGTGHGVGLDVHEPPRIAATSKEKIKKGMVFTIEPGIYIPGVGGVRIEDMVYVNEQAELLTSLPRDLEVIH